MRCFLLLVKLVVFFAPVLTLAQVLEFDSEAHAIAETNRLASLKKTPVEMLEDTQQIIDSIVQESWPKAYLHANVRKLWALHELERLKESQQLFPELLALAKKQNKSDIILQIEVFQALGDVSTGNTSDIKYRFLRLVERLKRLKDNRLTATLLVKIGDDQSKLRLLVDALATYQLAYRALEKTDDKITLAQVYASLGDVNANLGNFDAAEQSLLKSIAIIEETDNDFERSIQLYNLGNIYVKKGDLDEAKKHLIQAKQLSVKLKDDMGIAWADMRIADILIETKNWSQAVAVYQQVLPKFVEAKNVRMQFNTLRGLFRSNMALGNLVAAKQNLVDAKNMVDKTASLRFLEIYNQSYAQLEHKLGNFDSAYQHQLQAYEIAYERFERKQADAAQKHRVEFETALKEKENQSLTLQNKLNSATLARKEAENKVWTAVAVVILCVLIVVALLLRQQSKKRQFFKTLAHVDELTQAPNRRAIIDYAELQMSELPDPNSKLTVALIDFDHFKRINDTYGHKIGDDVLKAFAIACKKSLREEDKFGRFGGEEWLLVINDSSNRNIKDIFERLRESWNKACLELTSLNLECTFSMGVACLKNHEKVEDLIKRADVNLYKAKEKGRNTFVS